jgi:RNA polymerase sigma-70 factor (ECF subfamily)
VDDHALFKRARAGDEDAFAELFARHQRPLFRYAAYMCGDAGADDVVQDTFMAVLRQRDRRDEPAGTIQSYLFGIARHLLQKRLSSPRERSLGEPLDACHEAAVAAECDSILDQCVRAETVDALRAAIRTLPPDYREVVIVCELEGMKYADAADVLACPIGTIRSRLHRAKTMLAAALTASARREDI